MALARFDIRGCCGNLVKSVELDVRAEIAEDYRRNGGNGVWCEFTIANEYAGEAYSEAGITNYLCEGCYDSAYCVTFAGFVGKDRAVLVVRIVTSEAEINGVDDLGDLQDLISSVGSGYFAGKITWERE